MNTEPTSDKVACWSLCASSENCNWFTYDGIQMCRLFENCPEIDEEHYPQYISGDKDCQYIYCTSLLQIILAIRYKYHFIQLDLGVSLLIFPLPIYLQPSFLLPVGNV